MIRSEGKNYVVEFVVDTVRPAKLIAGSYDYGWRFAKAANEIEVIGNRYANPELLGDAVPARV